MKTAICPFKTLVKIFFTLGSGFEKQMVLVTSVVPYLYCPPESHKKISFLLENNKFIEFGKNAKENSINFYWDKIVKNYLKILN